MATDLGGVWRTIGGRRVFIKNGTDLATAMKESGKFNKKEEISLSRAKQRFRENILKYGDSGAFEDAILYYNLKPEEINALYDYATKQEGVNKQHIETIYNQYKGEQSSNTGYDDSSFKYLPEDDIMAYDKYEEMSDESYQKLDNQDVYLIQNEYIGKENSWDFNEALRNDQPVDEKLKGALDRACNTYEAKEDMASTRSVSFDYLRNAYGLDIPQYGDVDREAIANQMKSFIGSELSSKSYTSVSLNESGNGMFGNLAVKQKINMPKGTKMYVADNVGEYEAILGRNTKMVLKDVSFEPSKIAGFEKEYGKVIMTYEVVGNGE